MASPAQIAANQANSQKSTGPRSVEGKSASRFNALKHGMDAKSAVIPGEDPADYDAVVAAYLDDYRPASLVEFHHVDNMIHDHWCTRRYQLLEASATRALLAENPGLNLAGARLTNSPTAKFLDRVERIIASMGRGWHRSETALLRRRRQNADAAESQAAESQAVVQPAVQQPATPPAAPPAPAKLASFPQIATPALAPAPAPAKSTKEWPPCDPKTGNPLYFVG